MPNIKNWKLKKTNTCRSPGVSNSVSYAGHILTKKGLAGRIKRKNVSAGHNWRLKLPLYYKKQYYSNNLSNLNGVAGRTNTSGGPHAACGPRVWDPCSTCYKLFKKCIIILFSRRYSSTMKQFFWVSIIFSKLKYKWKFHIFYNKKTP